MIRDITIGQYYPAESPIHRIDARVKTVITLLYIISLFVINSFVGYAVVIASLAVTIKMSRVPFKFMIRGLRSLVLIIIFTAVINLLVTEGETPLLTIWRFTVTLEGVFFRHKDVPENNTSHSRLIAFDFNHYTDKAHRRYRVAS